MPGLRIRDATADDAPLLAEWAAAMAWETEGKRLDPAVVALGVSNALADPMRARYFIAMRQAEVAGRETLALPVGTLMLTDEWSDWRNGWWWWIQSVYVPPAERRTGVFAALYDHAASLARAMPGVIGLRLYVEHANTAAQRTYASLGMTDANYRVMETAFDAERADQRG